VVTADLPDGLDPGNAVPISARGSGRTIRLSRRTQEFLLRNGLVGAPRGRAKTVDQFVPVMAGRLSNGLKQVHDSRPLILAVRCRVDPSSGLGRQLRPLAPSSFARFHADPDADPDADAKGGGGATFQ
jgi:hypothetical protein